MESKQRLKALAKEIRRLQESITLSNHSNEAKLQEISQLQDILVSLVSERNKIETALGVPTHDIYEPTIASTLTTMAQEFTTLSTSNQQLENECQQMEAEIAHLSNESEWKNQLRSQLEIAVGVPNGPLPQNTPLIVEEVSKLKSELKHLIEHNIALLSDSVVLREEQQALEHSMHVMMFEIESLTDKVQKSDTPLTTATTTATAATTAPARQRKGSLRNILSRKEDNSNTTATTATTANTNANAAPPQ